MIVVLRFGKNDIWVWVEKGGEGRGEGGGVCMGWDELCGGKLWEMS